MSNLREQFEERRRRQEEKEHKRYLKSGNTLLYNIEKIIERVGNSEMSDVFFEISKKNIDFVAKKMNLTDTQAVLYCIFIEKNNESRVYIEEIAKEIGCKMVKMINLMQDFDELEKRQLVRCNRSSDTPSYRVPVEVVEAIKQNIVYKPESISDLNTSQLFEHLDLLFKAKDDGETSYKRLEEDIQILLQENITLHFCRQIEGYKKKIGDGNSLILLLFFCHKFVNYDDDSISNYE